MQNKATCRLKAKVKLREAEKRLAKFVVPIEYGLSLTKFTQVIGFTGGDVRSLRKCLEENYMTPIETDGKQYIRLTDAIELLFAIYGKKPFVELSRRDVPATEATKSNGGKSA